MDLPELRKKIGIVIESKEALDEDVENSESYYYMHIHPILDASGRSIGAMLIFVDKTALLRKENQLEVIGLISQICLGTTDLGVLYRELPEILSKRLEFPYVAIDLLEDDEVLTLGAAGFSTDDDGPVRVFHGCDRFGRGHLFFTGADDREWRCAHRSPSSAVKGCGSKNADLFTLLPKWEKRWAHWFWRIGQTVRTHMSCRIR